MKHDLACCWCTTNPVPVLVTDLVALEDGLDLHTWPNTIRMMPLSHLTCQLIAATGACARKR